MAAALGQDVLPSGHKALQACTFRHNQERHNWAF
jgi:hypothetical protein